MRRVPALVRAHPILFALTVVWAFEPLAHLVVHALRHGGVLTGANGYDPYDQAAYLAWIRDARDHLLASNPWQLGTPHDYVHPMFTLSGLVAKLGVSVQLAYLMWKPVAVMVLFCGFAAYVHHLLPGRPRAQAAALLLALFYETPVLAAVTWWGHPSLTGLFDLTFVGDDPNSALNLWGFDHTAIAIGLMPVCLIAVTRLRRAVAVDPAARARGWVVLAAVSGALVSWLRPWQGVMLLLMMAALPVLTRSRRGWRGLLAAGAVTALPLVYGFILARADPSWTLFQHHTTEGGRAPVWALAVAFGPLVALAALGLRRPNSDRDWLLLLWPLACAAVYWLLPEFPPHALSGVTLPLAVLAVRGWSQAQSRLRVPVALGGAAAATAIGLGIIPAAVLKIQQVWEDVSDQSHFYATDQEVLPGDEVAALRYLNRVPGDSGILAPDPLALSVPAMTGHPAVNGHFMWERKADVAAATTFFAPSTPPATRQAILRGSRARFVLANCAVPPTLGQAIAPVAAPVARFGCVVVYQLRS